MPDRPCCTGTRWLLLIMLLVQNFSGPDLVGFVHY